MDPWLLLDGVWVSQLSMFPRTARMIDWGDWQWMSGGWEEADWIIDQLTPWYLVDEAHSILGE